MLYESTKTARKGVKDGKTWGVVEIGPDFTTDLFQRYDLGPGRPLVAGPVTGWLHCLLAHLLVSPVAC